MRSFEAGLLASGGPPDRTAGHSHPLVHDHMLQKMLTKPGIPTLATSPSACLSWTLPQKQASLQLLALTPLT